MAQTGTTKLVISAGVISVDETGTTQLQIIAGIPSAWTEEEPPPFEEVTINQSHIAMSVGIGVF